MKIAIVGSRNLTLDVAPFLEGESVSEIVSGGARGIDKCAEAYAEKMGIEIRVFPPRYDLYGKAAPLKRNEEIVEYADKVYIFWDGSSRGSAFVRDACIKAGKPYVLIVTTPEA
ncbi:MAG: hypothetical protein IKB38_05800 [Clostridia bacterium]|nr:hypothetical protein [Clostridia bacterium]